MRMQFVLGAVALAAACFPASAQSLKPGLWEINNKSNNPQMDQAMAQMQRELASMPPEQRKQMEAMMGKPAAGGQGMAMRLCMTKEMAERNDVPMQDGCKITSQQRTGNTTKMAFACANPPSSGEGTFTMASPEAYSSKMTIKTAAHGKAETMTMEAAGRWVAADCGSVKPLARK